MSAKIKTLIGENLVKKGVVDNETLIKALETQSKEPISDRRKVGDILIDEFGVDRHIVYREVAKYYGFKEIVLDGYQLEKEQTEFIKSIESIL